MAALITYSVRVSSEMHKIEAWLASNKALAMQLQQKENVGDTAVTRDFAGISLSQSHSPSLSQSHSPVLN
jgi:E3 ubiquitin-protein ligase BIG BROTHER and related proteins